MKINSKGLSHLRKPIEQDIKAFDAFFNRAVKSNVSLLDVIMQYILRRKGKQMRPLIVIYSAKLLGEVNETTHRAATLIELLHTATLIHDDVVDDSNERRGTFTINALWKNKIAVLSGDYLLSRGMLTALESKDYELLEIVSRAVKDMSEGELLQMEKARRLDIDESVYFDIIQKKTASLMAASFGCGAASVSSDRKLIEKMRQIGEWAGIAFQIKDDLFDYEKTNLTGKPTGGDIKEKKMTLPLIYMLQNMPKDEKRRVIRTMKKRKLSSADIQRVMEQVNRSGGMEYATEMMQQYKTKALELLLQLPDNNARRALEEIIAYSVERKR